MPTDRFVEDGYAVVAPLFDDDACDDLAEKLSARSDSSAGTRCLLDSPWCRALAMRLKGHASIRPLLPDQAVAVQCTYFKKSVDRNWLVTTHQDLSIPVAERIDHPSLTGWSEKEGGLYVQAPVELLERLTAVRVHIDECCEQDGPLRVIPGSHLHGRIESEAAAELRRASGEIACLVPRGGALLMRPLLLHASSKSSGLGLRRVLHFVFGPPTLPLGLRWRHLV